MSRSLNYFRPGEGARQLARCQFVLFEHGTCGAVLTYPIKGMPWRRNIRKYFEFDLAAGVAEMLFSEVSRIRREFPDECLSIEDMWSDFSEKANPIPRHRQSGRLCYRIAISDDHGQLEEDYGLRDDSAALLRSALYTIVSTLIEPHEKF